MPDFLASDEAFREAWDGDRAALIKAIATRYRVNAVLVERLAHRDHAALAAAIKRGIAPRIDSFRVKLLSRFAIMEKNREVLHRLVNDFGIGTEGYFDVGCGMGFTLQSALDLGFDFAAGVEVDPSFSATALSIFDQTDRFEYQAMDFFQYKATQKYSLITFFDVLEHIGDVGGAVKKAISMLTSQGVIYYYQGNPRAVDMVLNESHYRLPGLSLLPPPLAADILMRAKKITKPDEYVVRWWPRPSDIAKPQPTILLHAGEANIRNGARYPDAADVLTKARARVSTIPGELASYLAGDEALRVRSIIDRYLVDLEEAALGDPDRFRVNYAMHSWSLFLFADPHMIPTNQPLVAFSRF